MINEKFELHLETIASDFNEQIDLYDVVFIIHHTDADGLGAALILKQMLKKLQKKKPFSIKLLQNNLEDNWQTYINNTLKENINKELKYAIFFSDLCPSHVLLNDFLLEYPNTHIDIYILDHHLVRKDLERKLHENIYDGNPTNFGLHGLKEIVGGTLNYLFAKAVDKSNEKFAWIAAISMGGDTLQHYNDYSSYNRMVIEDAVRLGDVQINVGICLFGGQFLPLHEALAHSILPYVPKVGGDSERAKSLLLKLGINPKIKVEELTQPQILQIESEFNIKLQGEYLTFTKRKGLLKFVFEHAQLLSIIGHDHVNEAFQIMGQPSVEAKYKNLYLEDVKKIVENLTWFVKSKKVETNHALIVDLTKSNIEPKEWSDIGSFSSINKLYNPEKVLIIGGNVNDFSTKYSLRCQTDFINKHNGKGVNIVIKKSCDYLGGTGGGHDLAGGMRLDSSLKDQLIENIDDIISSMND